MQACSTQLHDGLWHGHGKIQLTKGRVFIGQFYLDAMTEGKLYEMQKDNTYTLFNVKYDFIRDMDDSTNN